MADRGKYPGFMLFVGETTKTTGLVSNPISVPELKFIHASKRGHWWHYPDCKVHWDTMGPIWGRQDPGGPHVGIMNCAFWVVSVSEQFHHWFKWWFGSCSATNEHPVNQWPFIIYWTLANKITWNINKNTKGFLPILSWRPLEWQFGFCPWTVSALTIYSIHAN